MNIPTWSYPLSSFYPPPTPSNYYSYPYMQSPYNTNGMLNSSIQTNLNSSSGYESASNETSLVDPCFSSSPYVLKVSDNIIICNQNTGSSFFRNHILIRLINNIALLIMMITKYNSKIIRIIWMKKLTKICP
jgi:hypothetical protein